MAGVSRTQVLVVGAGPCGLMAALQLADRGVAVELVEEEWRGAGHSYALALHPRSLALLDAFGLAEPAIAAGRRLETMTLFEAEEPRATLRFGAADARFPFLVVLPQSALEELLTEKLAQKGVRVRWSHRLARLDARERGVAATVHALEKESAGYAVAHTEWVVAGELGIEAAFVIGADGHRSLVRRALGVGFEEAAPSQVFAIVECPAGETPPELRLVLDPRSVNACWPLPGARVRWSLELEAAQAVRAQERFKSRLTTRLGERFFHHLEEPRVRELLRERAPWSGSGEGELGWSVEVRFERRLAAAFGRERVWLAGDAAHLTGPLGVQSMNAGLDEACDLAARVARLLGGKDALELLEEYGRTRTLEWRFMLGLNGRLRPGRSASSFASANADRLLACLPATGIDLEALAHQLGLEVER